MKRTLGIFAIAVAVFIGGFAALRLESYLKGERTSEPIFQISEPRMIPAGLDTESAVGFDFRAAVRKVMPSVVSVDRMDRVRRGFWEEDNVLAQTGTGSGVIISQKGYILTNNHVVADAAAVTVRLSDTRSFEAKVIGTDPRSDLAVLKIEAPNLVPAELGDSSKLEIGEWVIAVGTPLGYANTVSVGIVSSLNRTFATGRQSALVDSIQTDAAINRGNSGGPLANSAGQVVGINTMIVSDTGGSVGLGFAIPIQRAQRVVNDIVAHGRVRYGQLGTAVYSRTPLDVPRVREALREIVESEPPKQGLIVHQVYRNSPAAQLGLQQLDVLLEIDGRRLLEPVDLTKALFDKRPGDRIQIKYWARGQEKTANVVLAEL